MKKLFLNLITVYQRYFSPALRTLFGHGCRFSPTCSEYAKQAIKRQGLWRGLRLSLVRLSHCHPYSRI